MIKSFTLLSVFSLLIIGLVTFSSCEPEVIDNTMEEEPPEIPRGPSLMFKDSISFLSEPSGQVRPDSTFRLILEAERGDSLLVSLEIFLNGQPLPTTDYTVNGVTPASSFFDLMGEDQNGFVWEIEIRAINDFTRVIYEFQLTAEDSRTDGVAITINTTLSETTPPNIELLTTDRDTVLQGDFAPFLIRVDALGSAIESMSVFRGANIAAAEDLMFDGELFASNPLPLEGDDRQFFEKIVEIKSDCFEGPVQNTLILTDSLGVEYTLELNFVNSESPTGVQFIALQGDTIMQGSFASFTIVIDSLVSDMDNMLVTRGDSIIPIEDLIFDGVPFTSNPLPLVGGNRRFDEKDIQIKADIVMGRVNNDLILTDECGVKYEVPLRFVNQ